MSAAVDSSSIFGLDETLLAAAVTATQTSGRSTLEFLEERSGLGPVLHAAMLQLFASGEYQRIMDKWGVAGVAVDAPRLNFSK